MKSLYHLCCFLVHFPVKIFRPTKPSKTATPRQINRLKQLDLNRDIDFLESDIDLGLDILFSNDSIKESMDPDTIYKALRPVPEFDGNPNVLTRFIRICDQIVIQYLKNEPGAELGNLCLLNGILNKITGNAARTINSNGIPESWQSIRNALINIFSDQRDETALYNDLSLLSQGNSTPIEFFDKCQNLFSTIMTYVTLHEAVGTTIEAKRDLYRKLTMQSFVRGLKEPLGSRIRCMRPETIEKALEFVQDELNVMYLQQRNEYVDKRTPSTPQQQGYSPALQKVPTLVPFVPPKPFNFPQSQPSWHRPMMMPPQQQQAAFRQPAFHQPRMPTRTQLMFRAQPPNYNPQNAFKFTPRNVPNNTGPKPMSGVSHFVTKTLPPAMTGHDWSKFGNPPPSNYFKTREMNYNETLDSNNYPYGDMTDYYYDYDTYFDPSQAEPEYYDTCSYDNGQYYDPTNALEAPQPSTSQTSQNESDFPRARTNPEPK